ncbi:MAG: hypothetical protein V1792_28900 [Pseudomonadota bacterium]
MMIRLRSMKDRLDPEQPESSLLRTAVYARSLKWVVLGTLLTHFFLSHGLCAGPRIPQDLAPQIWSRVQYDPKLNDPFFRSVKWTYPDWIREDPKGYFISLRSEDKNPVKDPPRLVRTAELLSNPWNYWHLLNFCEAGLLGKHTIQLFVPDQNNTTEQLRVLIRDGKFSCQYWQTSDLGAYTWTTTRQKLTLDKEMYRKGDVIRGRLDFECVIEPINREWIWKYGKRPRTIQVYGVFKMIVE